MKPDIYYSKSGLRIHPKLNNDWVIKVPTRSNRLSKTGSCGLKMAEKYDLENNKMGVIFIDISLKAYVMIPKEYLKDPVAKTCQGVKNSIFSYNVNEIVNVHNLDLVKIPYIGEIPEEYDKGIAGDVRKRFGL